MLGIFSRSIATATRTQTWDAPSHWQQPRYPQTHRQLEQAERQARYHAMRSTGMW